MRKRRGLNVDDVGRLVRGKSATPTIRTDEYDSMVVDPWSHYPPQPVQIKQNVSIYDEYDVLEEIGTGAFGVVHRCVQKSTGNVFAAKFVPTPRGEIEKETVRKEIETMSELRHPSLLSLHDAFEMDQELVMIYEFMSGGELFEKVSSEQNKMSEEESRKYIRQICNGLRHMHEMSYVHLDLKPENIMFSKKTNDQLKLIDFGLATKIAPNREVKVTTGTPEFVAPEVIGAKEIGFYTDMWSVGVLAYILLSGLSPFGGENDEETLENVRKCDWSMEGEPEFEQISEDAKDFIRRLLVADRRQRMTVHQVLEHPWLADLRKRKELEAIKIPAERFHRARNNVRNQYDAWAEPLAPIGRISQFSSLRIHQPDRFRIRQAKFDQNDAQPRFVLRPTDGDGREGQSGVSFFCKILSPTPIRLSWLKDEQKLKDGDKYRQQRNVNDYALTVTNLAFEDRGEYTVRAVNEYGQRECQMFLNVLSIPKKSPTSSCPPTPEQPSTFPKSTTISSNQSLTTLLQIPPLAADSGRRRSWAQIEMPNVAVSQQGPPIFSFPLRPRLIQKNHSCKLLCTVTSNPPPKIEWFKNREPVDLHRVQTMYKSGVASLEIFNTRLDDAGTYKCLASNEFGQTECSAPLSVETRHSQWMGGARERKNFGGDQQQKNLLQQNGAATSADMGNSRLMAGLVGERREKLVSRVQK